MVRKVLELSELEHGSRGGREKEVYPQSEGTEWPRALWLDGAQLGQQGTEMSGDQRG